MEKISEIKNFYRSRRYQSEDEDELPEGEQISEIIRTMKRNQKLVIANPQFFIGEITEEESVIADQNEDMLEIANTVDDDDQENDSQFT